MFLQALSLALTKMMPLLIKLTLRLSNNNSSQAKNKGNVLVVVDMVMAMATVMATVAHMLVALEVSDNSLELLMRAKEDVSEVEEVENGKSSLSK